MRKIPTLFRRDPDNMAHVLPEVHPDCQWVLDGEGVATRKYDGTCVLHDHDDQWWARREVKPYRTAPPNYWAVETDSTTGKTVGWEPIEQSSFVKSWREVIDRLGPRTFKPGTYELCGPKVNGNPEGFERHALISHATAAEFQGAPRDFDGLREFLRDFPHEGLVWHHPDGRMAKLKVRDFPKGD
jgi:hypothetical protein